MFVSDTLMCYSGKVYKGVVPGELRFFSDEGVRYQEQSQLSHCIQPICATDVTPGKSSLLHLQRHNNEGKGKEQEMLTTITNINNAINGVVWGWPALILLGVTGILMTFLTKQSVSKAIGAKKEVLP